MASVQTQMDAFEVIKNEIQKKLKIDFQKNENFRNSEISKIKCVIFLMRRGAPMTRNGNTWTHCDFRMYTLSEDHTEVIWSKKSTMSDERIPKDLVFADFLFFEITKVDIEDFWFEWSRSSGWAHSPIRLFSVAKRL